MSVNLTLTLVIILSAGAMAAYNYRQYQASAIKEKILLERSAALALDIEHLAKSLQEFRGYKEKYYEMADSHDKLAELISKLRFEAELSREDKACMEINRKEYNATLERLRNK